MPCTTAASIVTGIATVIVASSIAAAGVNVTHAKVTDTVSYLNPEPGNPPNSTVTLDSATTGNTFSTYDGKTGFTSTLGAQGGSFLVQATGVPRQTSHSYTASTTGTIDFTVSSGTFSLSPAIGSSAVVSPFGAGSITIKNLSTQAMWTLAYSSVGNAAVTGDLPVNAPAGNYELTFDLHPYYMTGVSGASSLQADLAFTPEPATLAALALPALTMRRRR